MKYKFSFVFNNKLAYPCVFSYISEGIYPIFFYGFSVYEIIKYTTKYSEYGYATKINIISKVLRYIDNELNRDMFRYDVSKRIENYIESYLTVPNAGYNNEIPLEKITSIAGYNNEIPLEKITSIVVDSLTESYTKGSLLDVDIEYKKEIQKSVYKYISTLVNIKKLDKLHSFVEETSNKVCISKSYPKYIHAHKNIIFVNNTKVAYISSNVLKNIDKNTEYANDKEVFKTASKESDFAQDHEINIEKTKEGIPLTEINIEKTKEGIPLSKRVRTPKYKSLSSLVPIDMMNKNSGVEYFDLESFLIETRKKLSREGLEQFRLSRTSFETSNIEVFNLGILDIVDDIVLEVLDNKTNKEAEIIIDDTIKVIQQKHADPPVVPIDVKSPINSDSPVVPIDVKSLINSDLPVVPIDIKSPINSEPVVPIDIKSPINSEPVIEVKDPRLVSVSEVAEVQDKLYKDLRFGVRWRFKTGNAYDKIWLNPDEENLTLEAKIPFKIILDYILFIEQLIYSNRHFYAASRAVTAIDDIIDVLSTWLIECKPFKEVPIEYEYMFRWFKWWAEGYRNEYINNMELNGLVVLEEIKDKMVSYFETRWGKRVVKYGEDGMYIYSEDFSFIDRIRGKKHGYAHREVNRNMMGDEYGLSEKDLVYDVENDIKGKRDIED